MKHVHHLALLELGRLVCGRFRLGQLGPDQMPVIRTEVAARELTPALVLNASAIRDGDSCVPPLVDRLLGQVETLNKAGLEAPLVKD